MTRKTLVTVVCAAVVYLSAACQEQPAPTPPATSSSASAVDPADVAFGYTDRTGSKLLMLPEMDNRPDSRGTSESHGLGRVLRGP